MSVALLIITDGRDSYLAETVAAVTQWLRGPVSEWWIFDDTGDDPYRQHLLDRYPHFNHINGGPRQGFDGAIRSAWTQLAERSRAPHVFHLEQDFVLQRAVDVGAMAAVLSARSYLVQLALRRQPWNDDELRAGGLVERYPGAFTECRDEAGRAWLEHLLYFTTNPSLYRRSLLLETQWPEGERSEGRYTLQLVRDGSPEVDADAIRFGLWGARDSGVWVQHIGHQRAGKGY